MPHPLRSPIIHSATTNHRPFFHINPVHDKYYSDKQIKKDYSNTGEVCSMQG